MTRRGFRIQWCARTVTILVESGYFNSNRSWINNIVKLTNKENKMLTQSDIQDKELVKKEVAKLIKSLTTLSNLVLIYLTLTWGYDGLAFIMRSILQ